MTHNKTSGYSCVGQNPLMSILTSEMNSFFKITCCFLQNYSEITCLEVQIKIEKREKVGFFLPKIKNSAGAFARIFLKLNFQVTIHIFEFTCNRSVSSDNDK